MASSDDRIEVQSIASPHRITRVNRARYLAMKAALLAALPPRAPGLSAAQAKAALLPHLSPDLFPGGEKAGWWMKCVQLDLEAKGVIQRARTKPLTWHRVG